MRNGSSRAYWDCPRLRRSFTPAPSEAGIDWMMRAIGRVVMIDPRWGRPRPPSIRGPLPSLLARPAEPFRDDRLVAGFHRRAVMHRVVVRRAVRLQVVPEHRHPLPRRDDQADIDERSLAAFLDVVEIDHERPGALSERGRGVALELVGLEIVGVRLELLRELVVLALARLRHFRGEAHRAADLFVERAHCRL